MIVVGGTCQMRRIEAAWDFAFAVVAGVAGIRVAVNHHQPSCLRHDAAHPGP